MQSNETVSLGDIQRHGDEAVETALRRKVEEALNDPDQFLPADQVFAELRTHHANRLGSSVA